MTAIPSLCATPRILLVKTTSLGDVVHNLPVVSDLRRQFPDARIDWVVEEGFADIPRLHPGVSTVIPVAVRDWRRALFSRKTWQAIFATRARLSAQVYDRIIDTQGLLKSALLCRCAQGERHGYASDSIREPLAARFYTHTHAVSRSLHAVERNRHLAAASCGYALPAGLDYGIRINAASELSFDRPYVVFLTATSRDDKLWPEDAWIALGQQLAAQGLTAVLPGGSAIELARAARIAAAIGGHALPRLDIAGLAPILAGAAGVVGVDTGLTHLAAALGRPTLALFCGSKPGLTGVVAPQPVFNLGGPGEPPAVAEVLSYCRSWQA